MNFFRSITLSSCSSGSPNLLILAIRFSSSKKLSYPIFPLVFFPLILPQKSFSSIFLEVSLRLRHNPLLFRISVARYPIPGTDGTRIRICGCLKVDSDSRDQTGILTGDRDPAVIDMSELSHINHIGGCKSVGTEKPESISFADGKIRCLCRDPDYPE